MVANRSTPSETEIVISRIVSAPRELVFQVWTDPKHVALWWGPQGFRCTGCKIDLKVGGTFYLDMFAPDGNCYPCCGTFREIVPPERLVYTNESTGGSPCGAGLPPRATVTITFEDQSPKTKVTIHTQLNSAADRDAVIQSGFDSGWNSALQSLEDYLQIAITQ